MAKKVKSPFHLKKLVLLFDAEQKLPEKGRMNKKLNIFVYKICEAENQYFTNCARSIIIKNSSVED